MMQRHSRAFLDLQHEWDEILRRDGFVDIEKEGHLKQSAAAAYRNCGSVPLESECKFAYFMLLEEWLQKEKDFACDSDRLIMHFTASGWTIQEISQELKRLEKPKHNRDTIRYIRRRYEHKWGIRSWKPQQMVSRRVRTR
jgi:hypothetical protein